MCFFEAQQVKTSGNRPDENCTSGNINIPTGAMEKVTINFPEPQAGSLTCISLLMLIFIDA
jgi:hypothetical protein